MRRGSYNVRCMSIFLSGYYKIVTFIFVVLTCMLTLPRLSPVIFIKLPAPSPTYDCDDAAMAMYHHFNDFGIESTPVIGNLDMTGEKYNDSNHVWLLVKSGNREIAYDWGFPRLDRQHYEGYPISIDYLTYAMSKDR